MGKRTKRFGFSVRRGSGRCRPASSSFLWSDMRISFPRVEEISSSSLPLTLLFVDEVMDSLEEPASGVTKAVGGIFLLGVSVILLAAI